MTTGRHTKERPKSAPAAPRFELDESGVFGRFDLFAKRCRKLAAMFTTIEQFAMLSEVCVCLIFQRERLC